MINVTEQAREQLALALKQEDQEKKETKIRIYMAGYG